MVPSKQCLVAIVHKSVMYVNSTLCIEALHLISYTKFTMF